MERRLVLLALWAVSLSGIGLDLYTPSMPAIAQYFQVDETSVKLTISVYLLGLALGQIFFGILSDTFGRRKMLLLGVGLYAGAGFLAPFSEYIFQLLCLRGIQGLGTGAVSALARAILSDRLEGISFLVAMAYLSLVWAIFPIIAPVIGGYLQHYFGWKSNFYAYGLYGMIIFCSLFFLLPETLSTPRTFSFKELVQTSQNSLKHPLFLGCAIITGLTYSYIVLFNVVGPFIIQVTLHKDAATFGYIALLVSSGFLLGALLNRILFRYMTQRAVMDIALSIGVLGAFLVLFFAYKLTLSVLVVTLPIYILIVGAGFIFPNAMSVAMRIFPETVGVSSALSGLLYALVTTFMSALISHLPQGEFIPIAWAIAGLTALNVLVYLWAVRDRIQS